MIYLRSFSFLSRRADEAFTPMETCYASLYPYGVFPRIGLEGAKILDLDTEGAPVRRWTELENVRLYHDFFSSHEREFSAMGDVVPALENNTSLSPFNSPDENEKGVENG